MRKDMGLLTYKSQTLHFSPNINITLRWDFANKILDLIDTGELDLKKIWFVDEAHFLLSGQMNRQNYGFGGLSTINLSTEFVKSKKGNSSGYSL
ncbi:hypothetical protein CDAR_582801 [Caerostris darwini]|uniref:Uncharacterized protein n=1 Tax=Caerostris darwini TaxID=1538125 RepID=A0AAV4PNT3_9ARAC|nr:hypothetical protein CDAR_582801 [Caerostris darwini]